MKRYLLYRIASLVPILFGVSVVVFLLVRLIPGDPVVALLGMEGSQSAIDALRAHFALNAPLPMQYLVWLRHLLTGDFGQSIQSGQAVLPMLLGALVPTLWLSLAATAVSLIIAIPAGVVAATRRDGPADFGASLLALFGLSMPSFWIGVLLILGFTIYLPLLPASGYVAPSTDFSGFLAHIILPAITLGTALAASVMRMTRSAMLDVLGADFVRTARAKGLPRRQVIWRHAFGNAQIPIITLLGIQFGQLLGGVVITETVFSWPGIGKLTVDAIFARDYPVVQGAVLLTAALFVLVNLLTDMVYALVDPRLRRS
ncbi:ABC transporter permease [Acidimangrovimonas sediminis]|uniref:ABC transporter permease n=1 Tax=Acidimangrovimonas sediminis TaxID=2056283 RepID=UPI000C80EBBF|nr:ABC transporter permease [Acidimangrovimonas sediminis]